MSGEAKQIVRIPQVDGVVREVLFTTEDAEVVRDDPTMIDHVDALRIVDLYPDGTRERIL